jgi:hypothetical protein
MTIFFKGTIVTFKSNEEGMPYLDRLDSEMIARARSLNNKSEKP